MSSIKDLFTPKSVSEIKFNLSEDMLNAYEKMAKARESCGGHGLFNIKVAPGGAGMFIVTSGNRKISVDKFEGVIVANHQSNALFPPGNTQENTRPICSSMDGITGVNSDGECISCETCRYNAFESDTNGGRGKACKNMRRFYIMIDECPTPFVMSAPPTSILPFADYATLDVAALGLGLDEVVTEFSLENVVNSNNNPYSIINFKMIGKLEDKSAAFCKNAGKSLLGSQLPKISGEDYNREPEKLIVQGEPNETEKTVVPNGVIGRNAPYYPAADVRQQNGNGLGIFKKGPSERKPILQHELPFSDIVDEEEPQSVNLDEL